MIIPVIMNKVESKDANNYNFVKRENKPHQKKKETPNTAEQNKRPNLSN